MPVDDRPRHQRKRRRLSRQTRKIYIAPTEDFLKWVRQIPGLNTETCEKAGRALSDYFDFPYFDGNNPSKGRAATYGLAGSRSWSAKPPSMPLSRMTQQGWSNATRVKVRDGAPWEMVVVVAYHLCLDKPLRLKVLAVAAMVVGFDSYARGSELLGVLKHDVVRPAPVSRTYRWWALAFATPDPFGAQRRGLSMISSISAKSTLGVTGS